MLTIGDIAPAFMAESSSNPRYRFDTAAGRYIVLAFIGSSADPAGRLLLNELLADLSLYDDMKLCFFAVSADPADRERLKPRLPGVRFFWDGDGAVSRLYAAQVDGADAYRPYALVLDPMLRVIARAPGVGDHPARLRTFLHRLRPVDEHAGAAIHAPVLIAPRIFEPDFCQRLIAAYDNGETEDSGFMREVDGKTVGMIDHSFKRRADHYIEDAALRQAAAARIVRRLFPLVHKAFAFTVTRMERYIVACYDAGQGGYFRPHRDNTTKGTAHRRFAVTINLNAEDYDGGDLRFPEFGTRSYRAPTGGAVVFSCSLLHEALPVTRGRRYAFLPFLYDDAAAALRAANNPYLGEEVGLYQPDGPEVE